MTARAASMLCTLSALALPALAGGPYTITAAERSVGASAQEVQPGTEGNVVFAQYDDSDSNTDLSGFFNRNLSGGAGISSALANIDSDIVGTPDGFVLDNATTTRARVSDNAQFQSGSASGRSSTLLGFDIAEPGSFTLEGLVSGEGFNNGFDSIGGSSFTITLTGPAGLLLDESFDVRDLPQTDIGVFVGSIPISFSGALGVGSYELELSTSTSAFAGFGSNLGTSNARLGHDLTFAVVVPAPSALALLAVAPLAIRRKR